MRPPAAEPGAGCRRLRSRDGRLRATSCGAGAALGDRAALARGRAHVLGRRRAAAARLGADRAHAGAAGRRAAVGAPRARGVRGGARGAHRQPGRPEGAGPGCRRSTSRAGRSPPTPTSPARSTRTRASTRPTASRRSSAASTTRCSGPTRSSTCERPGAAGHRDWLAPIVADAEAGFGGPLNAFELMKAMIEAGAAGVHFEDQLASAKKCGHMGGKVLVPTAEHVRTLIAARLAADVADVPTIVVARTDCARRDAAHLRRRRARPAAFLTGERTAEGFYDVRNGLEVAIARGARLRPLRRPDLVRDLDAGPRRGTALRRGGAHRASRTSSSPTTARPRSTGGATSTTRRSRASKRSSGRWATASSS